MRYFYRKGGLKLYDWLIGRGAYHQLKHLIPVDSVTIRKGKLKGEVELFGKTSFGRKFSNKEDVSLPDLSSTTNRKFWYAKQPQTFISTISPSGKSSMEIELSDGQKDGAVLRDVNWNAFKNCTGSNACSKRCSF